MVQEPSGPPYEPHLDVDSPWRWVVSSVEALAAGTPLQRGPERALKSQAPHTARNGSAKRCSVPRRRVPAGQGILLAVAREVSGIADLSAPTHVGTRRSVPRSTCSLATFDHLCGCAGNLNLRSAARHRWKSRRESAKACRNDAGSSLTGDAAPPLPASTNRGRCRANPPNTSCEVAGRSALPRIVWTPPWHSMTWSIVPLQSAQPRSPFYRFRVSSPCVRNPLTGRGPDQSLGSCLVS